MEEAAETTPEVSDEAQAKILKEVRIAAGRLGRLTLWGADLCRNQSSGVDATSPSRTHWVLST